MSKKYLERAAREQRVAVLPEWLQEGRTVWYWRETLCGDDLCPDSVGVCCPINHSLSWNDPAVLSCARQHPVLQRTEIWGVLVMFTPRGMQWVINDLAPVDDRYMREVFFASEKEARKRRPREVVYG